MIGRILAAAIGRRIAGPSEGGKGAAIGFFAPVVARRIVGPMGLALVGGYAAKKLWDRHKARRAEA